MSLEKYKEKRDFSKTAEPEGKSRKKARKQKIFVVQYHEARAKHYDFRLEHNGVLLSWAVPKGPSMNPADKRLAVHVEDHPLDYASFEGVIPKGEYGAGSVIIWDKGTFVALESFNQGLKKGSLKFELFGERLKGKWALVRLKDEKNWLLIKDRDEHAKSSSSSRPSSVVSGMTSKQLVEAKSKNPTGKFQPQLAKLESEIPKGKQWAFEIKYDGFRIMAFIEQNSVKLLSRNFKDYSQNFPEVKAALEKLANGRAMILDGEMIVPDESGRSDFGLLQTHIKTGSGSAVYVVFDLLALDGKDLRLLPLKDRKAQLEKLLKKASLQISYSQHVQGNGEKCFEAAQKLGLEGVVAKKLDSLYSGSRNGDWVKIKCRKRQEFVIGGFSLSTKKPGQIASLMLGAYQNGKLIFYGRAGSGITEDFSKHLLNLFKKLKCKTSPFFDALKLASKEQVVWVKPKLVAEIEFAELTQDNLLRQASFKGLREDKGAGDVELKQPEKQVMGVKISHPDKVIFPEKNATKFDVASYYQQAAARMFPYVKNRLLSVVRCNSGVQGECFYKKHPTGEGAEVKRKCIKNSEGEKEEYFYIDSPEGLISEAQLGSIEFHTWASEVTALENPNILVFDLDPDEGLQLSQVRQGAKHLKSILNSLSLKCFLKTSGGKGYHIVVPFSGKTNWEKFSEFAKKVAVLMEEKWPHLYTSNMRKASRKGKIFVDWVRNGRGATSICPYSLRARKQATVSMPIFWSELDTTSPTQFDLHSALVRLKKPDPWKSFFKTRQSLS